MMKTKIVIDLSLLEGLKQSLVSKILKPAITVAARIVRDAVKSNAENIKRYGFTAKSIGIKVKIYGMVAVAMVGPRSNWYREKGVRVRGKHKGEPIRFRPSYTAHLVEKGTKRSQARAFLKPALDSTADQYLTTCAKGVEDGISKQLSKSK